MRRSAPTPEDLNPQPEFPSDDWAFAFPWIGEAHPLRRRFRRRLYCASSIASVLHLLVFGAWMLARHHSPPKPQSTDVVVDYIPFPPPAIGEIVHPRPPAPIQVLPPDIGIPEPVDDFLADQASIVPEVDLSKFLTGISDHFLGDSIVFNAPIDTDPMAAHFEAIESQPVLVHLEAPAYPDLAREAGIEAPVVLRVLVGIDGRVHEVVVLEGHPMLNRVAEAAVRKAMFKPALQQGHPIAVWVDVPMIFSLNH